MSSSVNVFLAFLDVGTSLGSKGRFWVLIPVSSVSDAVTGGFFFFFFFVLGADAGVTTSLLSPLSVTSAFSMVVACIVRFLSAVLSEIDSSESSPCSLSMVIVHNCVAFRWRLYALRNAFLLSNWRELSADCHTNMASFSAAFLNALPSLFPALALTTAFCFCSPSTKKVGKMAGSGFLAPQCCPRPCLCR